MLLVSRVTSIVRVTPRTPVTVYTLPMLMREFANGNSGTLDGSGVALLMVDVNVTGVSGGVTPSLKVFVERLDSNGTWFPLWAPTITTPGMTSTTIGPGALVAHDVGATCRFRYETAGSITFSASVRSR